MYIQYKWEGSSCPSCSNYTIHVRRSSCYTYMWEGVVATYMWEGVVATYMWEGIVAVLTCE